MPTVPEADLEHILAHTRDLWEPVRGQNIFVTGGTGFFGRWLVESFAYVNRKLDLGARMTVLTRRANITSESAAVRYLCGDVRELHSDKALPSFPFIIHAATESTASLYRDDPLGMFDTIVEGTRRTLDFAVASGARRFLLTSSGAVYGRQPSELTHVPEAYAGAPPCVDVSSVYGEGKRAAELLCACYQKTTGMEPVIARCFAFVGPLLPLDAHFAVGNFIRDALNGGPIQVGGDGSPYRSYLYAADLAIWLWTLLFKGAAGAAYNVGSGEDLDIEALARTVARHTDPPCDVQIAKKRNAGQPPARYVPDVTRITRELKLPAIIGLDESIARTMAFHRNS